MKKLYLLITFILLTFLLFLIIIFKPRNYIIDYQINDLFITEKYQKNEGYYIYIDYKDLKYPIYINKKYNRKRKLIKSVIVNELDKEACLNIFTQDKDYLVCSKDNEITTIESLSKDYQEKFNIKKEEKLLDTYKNIAIYNKDLTYLIWNYKGFYQINKNYNNLDIFKNDNYQNNLSYQTENYLIFPNYDNEYYFTKLYVYDIKKNNLKDIYFDFEISYDSYYLGHISNNAYLIDKKNQNEYQIDLKNKSIEKISKDNTAKYYNGSKFEDMSITKLINNEIRFKYNNIYNYSLENNKLYLNIKDFKILITPQNVKQIVHIVNDTVYYLVDDKLYSYKYLENNKLLLKYNEWLFNYNNHIFIFN